VSAARNRSGTKPSRVEVNQGPLSLSSGPKGAETNDRSQNIQQLIDILKRNELAELEWEGDGYRIRLRREAAPSGPSPVGRDNQPPLTEVPVEKSVGPAPVDRPGTVTVTSPIVGTFYRSPSPDADPYVEEGDLVKKGQVLCIVEAMKLMNEIESEVHGRVVTILAESTKPVEYGQPLFLIDPTPGA
jgi:acetyl-CoA carboxylase biotin carboxyl carrier protein